LLSLTSCHEEELSWNGTVGPIVELTKMPLGALRLVGICLLMVCGSVCGATVIGQNKNKAAISTSWFQKEQKGSPLNGEDGKVRHQKVQENCPGHSSTRWNSMTLPGQIKSIVMVVHGEKEVGIPT